MNAKPKDIDRLIEESKSREREALEQFEAVSALFGEVFLQLKELRPQIEKDPARLLGHLEILKAANDMIVATEEFTVTHLEQSSKRAEEISSQAATENNPEIKARLLEHLSRITNRVTSLTDKVRRIKTARQRRLEGLELLTASINELVPTVETPAEQKPQNDLSR